jgi:hypothetical protein
VEATVLVAVARLSRFLAVHAISNALRVSGAGEPVDRDSERSEEEAGSFHLIGSFLG